MQIDPYARTAIRRDQRAIIETVRRRSKNGLKARPLPVPVAARPVESATAKVGRFALQLLVFAATANVTFWSLFTLDL